MNSLPAQQVEEWANVGDTDEMKKLTAKLDKYTASLAKATNTSVYEYLTSVKGYSEDDLERMQLGYCEDTETLVIPVTTGLSSLRGFIYMSVVQTATGYAVSYADNSDDTSGILIGDPGYDSQQNQDLIVVSDPLDLYRLRSGVDIKTDGVSAEFSAAIPGSQISAKQRERLRGINPRRIVFIRGEDETAKKLEKEIRAFCAAEFSQLAVVTLNAKDVSEYLKITSNSEESLKEKITSNSEESLKEKIKKATAAIISDRLLSWLTTQPPALKTGYKSLDKHVRIPVGAMTIIAGRPGHGKTTFLYNLLMQMVDSDLYADKKFYFFSCEESELRIRQKMFSRILQKDAVDFVAIAKKHKLPEPKSGEDLIQKYALKRQKDSHCYISEIEAALEKLNSRYGLIWVEDNLRTVEKLASTIRKLNDKEAIGAIFIDYMQRIGTEKDANSIRESTNHVSDVLRKCAVDTGLPLIVGAQINREAAKSNRNYKTDQRPAQQDLKESGNLEEDANLILGVYNETQARIDKGNRNEEKQEVHTIQVYTMKSRDSEPFETKFVMTNRLFREPETGEV
jgi:replicative DNA helicase